MEREEKEKQETEPEVKKDPTSQGISGYATLTLRDGKTGEIKQQVTAKNTILARGLDWIIGHVVSGRFPNSSIAEDATTEYHGTVTGSQYITSGADKNPFKSLLLLHVRAPSNVTPSFTEGVGTPSPSIYLHVVEDGTGATQDGKDYQTYDEKLGDSGSNSGTTHAITSDPSTRTLVLGGKNVNWDPSTSSYTNTEINTGQSKQSNEDSSLNYKFQKVYIVFNFATTEGNGTINSICWSNTKQCQYVGARLEVSPAIDKTNADTLDITYTFDLTPS